jgi:uncharacterized protein YlaI
MLKINKCPCGKEFGFYENASGIKKRVGLYCCKKCMYKYRKRPSGLDYNIVKENNGWFKKGTKPWSYGIKGIHMSPATEFRKGSTPWIKGKNGLKNEKHPNWKGDNVGISALHSWVKRRLNKPIKCNFCGETKRLDLANKSGNYLRNLDDWYWLCKKCHNQYDNVTIKGWKTRRKKNG